MYRCIVCGRLSSNQVCDRCYAHFCAIGICDDEVIIQTYRAIDRQIEEAERYVNNALLEARVIA